MSRYCLLALHDSTDRTSSYPSKHESFPQCYFHVGPPSSTLAQQGNNIEGMPCVRWVQTDVTGKKGRWFNAASMLYHRRRLWSNIGASLGLRLVSCGWRMTIFLHKARYSRRRSIATSGVAGLVKEDENARLAHSTPRLRNTLWRPSYRRDKPTGSIKYADTVFWLFRSS